MFLATAHQRLQALAGRVSRDTRTAAVCEQIIISATHVLLQLLAARATDPALFGAFAILSSFNAILLSIAQSFLVAPLLVFLPSKTTCSARHYAVFALCGAAVMGLAGAAAMWVTFYVARLNGSHNIESAAVALMAWALVMPPFYTARALLYARGDKKRAVRGAIAHPALFLIALAIFSGGYPISLITIMTAGALAAAGTFFYWITPDLLAWFPPTCDQLREKAQGFFRDEVPRFVNYGKWIFLNSLAESGFQTTFYALVSGAAGLGAAGVLRASQLLNIPILQFLSATDRAVLPKIASAITATQPGAWALYRQHVRVSLAFATLYTISLFLFTEQVVRYAIDDIYAHDLTVFRIGLIAGLLSATQALAGTWLRAIGEPKKVFLWNLSTQLCVVGAVGFVARQEGAVGAAALRLAGALVAAGGLTAAALASRRALGSEAKSCRDRS